MLLSAGRYSALITGFSLLIDWLLVSLGLLVSSRMGNLWVADAAKRWGVADYLKEYISMARGARVEQTDERKRFGGPRKPARHQGVAKGAMFGFFVIVIVRRLLSFGDVVLLSLGPTQSVFHVSQSSGSDECTKGLPGLLATSGNRSQICVTSQNGGVATSTEELCSRSAYGSPTGFGGYEGVYLGFGFGKGSESSYEKSDMEVVAMGDARLQAFTGLTKHYADSQRQAPYAPPLVVYGKDGTAVSDESASNGLFVDTIVAKDVILVNGSDVAQLTFGARWYEWRYNGNWRTGLEGIQYSLRTYLGDDSSVRNLTGVVLDLDEIEDISTGILESALEFDDGPSELHYRTVSRISHGDEVLHSLSSVIEITFSYDGTTVDDFVSQVSDVNIWEVYSYSLSLSEEGPYLSEWPVKACDHNYYNDTLKFRGSSLLYCSGATYDSTLQNVLSGVDGEEMLLILDEKIVYFVNGGVLTDSVITLPEGVSEIVGLDHQSLLYEDPTGSIVAAGLSGDCFRITTVSEKLYVVNLWFLSSASICIAIASLLVWGGWRNIASVYKASPWEVVRSQLSRDGNCESSRRCGYLEVTPLSYQGHTYISVDGNVINTEPGVRVQGKVIRSQRDTAVIKDLTEC